MSQRLEAKDSELQEVTAHVNVKICEKDDEVNRLQLGIANLNEHIKRETEAKGSAEEKVKQIGSELAAINGNLMAAKQGKE